MNLLKRLNLYLIIISLASIIFFAAVNFDGSFEPGLLLSLLNTIFTGILPFIVAFFAARTFLKTNMTSALLMACGMLVFGLGSTIAGWLRYMPDGVDLTVTIHNISALIAGVFHLTSAIWADIKQGARTLQKRKAKLTLFLVGACFFILLVSVSAFFNILPTFTGISGFTTLRQIVLWSSIVFFFAASVLYVKHYQKTNSKYLFWYSTSLALTTIGLFAVCVQSSVGSAIGWVGRIDQYIGGICALASILAARKEARSKGSRISDIITEFFTDAEAGYRSLVETSSDAVLSVDEEFRILFINTAAEKLLGYTHAEATKLTFLDLFIRDATKKLLRDDLKKFMVNGVSILAGRPIQLELKEKGSRHIPIELYVSIRKLSSGVVSTYFIRDITRRKQNEARIKRQNIMLNAINRIYEKGVECETIEELGRACLNIVEGATESRMSLISEAESDGQHHFIAVSNPGWETCSVYDPAGGLKSSGNFEIRGLHGSVYMHGKSVLTNEPFSHTDSIGIPEGHPSLFAFLSVPFIRDGKVAGMVAVANRESGYRDEDREMLEALVPTIYEVIQHKKAEQESHKNESLLRTVTEGATDPIFLKDRQSRILIANAATAQAIGIPTSDFLGKNDLEFYQNKEKAAIIVETDRRIMDSDTSEVVEEQIPTPCGVRTFLSSKVPWHDKDGKVIGLVGVARDITERKNLEMQLKMLYEMAGKLLASEKPQSIINELCTNVMQFLDCQVFFNYLLEKDNILHLNAYAGIPEEKGRQIETLQSGTAVCGCVARDAERIVAENIQYTDDPRTELVKSLGVRAYACHPLLNRGETIGTLSFGTTTRDSFTAEELDLMKAVADHVAVAINRARDEEKIREMNRELIDKSQLITEFFTNISHEFKTPLSIILIELELMDFHLRETGCGYSERMQRMGEVMRQNAYRLSRLIQNLLDVTKLDAGFMNINLRNADIVSYVSALTDSVGDAAQKAGIQVYFKSDCSSRLMPIDIEKTERIMLNLLSNAIKHTSEGGRIEVEIMNYKNKVNLSVKDTGEGIPHDKKEIIFDRFRQVNTSLTRSTEGSGIGLSLVKAFVELLKGQIWFESEHGCGSEFFIELPVLPFDEHNAGPHIEGMSMGKKIEMEFSDIRKLETV